MITWLPERIYNRVKDNEDFKIAESNLLNVYNLETLGLEDYRDTLKHSEELKVYLSVVANNIPDYMQRELTIIQTEDELSLLTMLRNEKDIENILMIYYQLIDNPYIQKPNKNLEYRTKYIELVEASDIEFSTRIWVKYFQFKAKANVGLPFVDFLEYLKSINVPNKEEPYVYDIITHKTLDEIHYWLTIHNATIEDCINIENFVKSLTFKYDKFNLYTLRIKKELFLVYFYERNFLESRRILHELVEYINWGISNPEYTNKALNHHNLVLNKCFNEELGFFSELLKYLPNLHMEIPEYSTKDRFAINNQETLNDFNEFLGREDYNA